MPRSKRCLCIDCKPATDKTAMELIMFSEPSPEKEPKSSLVSSKLTKLAPKFENDLDEEDKKLNVKLDSLRDEIKELESEHGLNNLSIKKQPPNPNRQWKKSERQLLYEKISYQIAIVKSYCIGTNIVRFLQPIISYRFVKIFIVPN